MAARRGNDDIAMEDFDAAKDRVIMGLERRSMLISDRDKRMTAYHEAGHALVGRMLPGTDPVYKVTIIPRGRALGVTHFLPIEDRHTYPKTYLVNNITNMMGGRAAEEIVFDETFYDLSVSTFEGLTVKIGPEFLRQRHIHHVLVFHGVHEVVDSSAEQRLDRLSARCRQGTEWNDGIHVVPQT